MIRTPSAVAQRAAQTPVCRPYGTNGGQDNPGHLRASVASRQTRRSAQPLLHSSGKARVRMSRPNSHLSPDANRTMFDGIVDCYDRMNRLLSLGLDRRWRRKGVEALAPRAGQRILDVGCGTGDLAIEVLRQCPGCTVVGIDLSQGMLERAREKLAEAGLADSVLLQVGDATELAFADGAFDGIASAFCLRNVVGRPRAFREMRRVLTPGGRIVLAELTAPENPIVRLGHRIYTRGFVPLAGRLLARREEAYRYLVDSIQAFPTAQTILALMAEAGFAQPRAVPLTAGVVTLFIAAAPLA